MPSTSACCPSTSTTDRPTPPLVTLALAALIALLAAPVAAAQTTFAFQLFGQAERPPVQTEAYGTCTGVLAEDESSFTLSCEHNVSAPIAAHIHRGFSDENGDILFNLGSADSPVQATWNLDEEEAIRLLAGGLYVNVHSTGFPDGEIRGQVRANQPVDGRRLAFKVRGDQEVPPVNTTASGACVAAVDFDTVPFLPPQNVTLDLRCAHDVSSPIAAHVHSELRGVNGAIVIDLGNGSSPIEQFLALSDTQAAALFNGRLYVNVHNSVNPDGAIRGQMDGCIESDDTLCLLDGRFEATIAWISATDFGAGRPVRETADSGMFWFFRPSNLELLIKVLDACGVNDHYWVFHAATTNVGYELRVTDTLARLSKSYENTLGDEADTVLDTGAFATCP